ncbi:MAG: FAD-dependent oxidoreductase [Acidobacteria bacterium]|nr:FAD-dependent oxidoreductase [Acidobacteriota bacterium]
MDRRTFLKSSGVALAGFGVGACATTPPRGALAVPRRAPINLAPVRASFDRVIRTTVGLRPHRDSGFVLRAEKLDAKTLIHNYGHAGAGMSLGWGCGVMVAEFAQDTGQRRVAVIGCGSPGLTTARQLQRRGFDVTIYAATVPPDTTSNMSLAGFTPTTALVNNDRRTPAWDAQFVRAAEMSYRQLQLMVSQNYGVYWIDSYNATDNPMPGQSGGGRGGRGGGGDAFDADLLPEHLRPNRNREVLGPGEHPFPTKYAVRTPALSIEPSIYLDALVRDFLMFGGKIVIRKFDTPRDLMSLAEPVVVNCTGLGSFTLFDDKELVPIKGQLTVMVPQPEVNYRAGGRTPSGGNASMNPRSDGIVVGNLQDRGNWSLEPDEEVRQRNVQAAIEFFSAMRPPAPGARLTRSAPPQTTPSVQSFFDAQS